LYTLFLYITLISLPLLFLVLINRHIRKINKDINQLSQEIVKASSKMVDKLEKADVEKK
jgi:hypothetical protein